MPAAPAAQAPGPAHAAERLGGQGIAGQDAAGFAENLVIGRPPPAHVVVVHGRQIVVDERIGMDELETGGKRHDACPLGAEQFGKGQAQGRPQPLAPGKE